MPFSVVSIRKPIGCFSSKKKTYNKLYISDPMPFTVDIDTVYRWDSRPPELILKIGFSGCSTVYFNNVFGCSTVFASHDMEGSDFYFKELEDGMAIHGDSRTYHLYCINCKGVPAVPIHGHENDACFIKPFATRFPDVKLDEYGFPPLSLITRFSNYVEKIASKNHEVQLLGPIMPDRINYIEKRTLSNEAWNLRNRLKSERLGHS